MSDYAVRIERNVPLPPGPRPRGKGGKARPKYPWREMEVGDSFRFPSHFPKSNAFSAARNASVATGRLFVVRRVDEGYRCWRIE